MTFVIDRRGMIVGDAIIGPVDGSPQIEARFERAIEEALAT